MSRLQTIFHLLLTTITITNIIIIAKTFRRYANVCTSPHHGLALVLPVSWTTGALTTKQRSGFYFHVLDL